MYLVKFQSEAIFWLTNLKTSRDLPIRHLIRYWNCPQISFNNQQVTEYTCIVNAWLCLNYSDIVISFNEYVLQDITHALKMHLGYDDVMIWKRFPPYWPVVSLTKGPWRKRKSFHGVAPSCNIVTGNRLVFYRYIVSYWSLCICIRHR